MKSSPAKRRIVIIALGILVVATAGVVIWPSPDPPEPEYQGKKLSEWMIGADKDSDATRLAVQSFGRPAIPFLVRLIQEHDPGRYSKRAAIFGKFPGWVQKMRFVKSWAGQTKGGDQGRLYRAHGASIAFEILGLEASSAIPQLSTILLTSSPDGAAGWAAQSLAFLGPDSLPPLLGALENPGAVGARRSVYAASSLRYVAYLGSNACPAVPALVRCVIGGDLGSGFAREALENFAMDPSVAPKVRHIGKPAADPALRRAVICALQDMGTNAAAGIQGNVKAGWAMKVVERALEDSDATVRTVATNTCGKIRSEMLANGISHF